MNNEIVEIYWESLTKECQDKILKIFGNNCDYDLIPIAVLKKCKED